MDVESMGTQIGTETMKNQDTLKVQVQITQNLLEKNTAGSAATGARTADTGELSLAFAKVIVSVSYQL